MEDALIAARARFGYRMRDVRESAKLTGRDLARLLGVDGAWVSRVEHGKQLPTDPLLTAWCRTCSAEKLIEPLRAARDNADGLIRLHQRRNRALSQQRKRDLRSTSVRVLAKTTVPDMLRTEDYHRGAIAFHIEHGKDLDPTLTTDRRYLLDSEDRHIAVLLQEQVLYSRADDDPAVQDAQLTRLLELAQRPQLDLAIITTRTGFVVRESFTLFDSERVEIELLTSTLTLSGGTDVARYAKAWHTLSELAVRGAAATALIETARDDLYVTHQTL